ncbi:PaaI family thioesterase [Minwuia sp.]|uniref:PaaI family thioesterase n=1 Tax=Minwuia sp. TaxID=2493630 RepID=UPI003A90542A
MSSIPEGFRPSDMPSPFVVENGPLYYKVEDGFLLMGFRVETRHTNAAGGLHGGMLMTLIDMQLNSALNYQLDTAQFIPTVAVTVDFIAPAVVGDWVQGRTEVLKRGRSTVFTDCRIIKHDRTLVARGSGIFKVANRPDNENDTLDPRKLFA